MVRLTVCPYKSASLMGCFVSVRSGVRAVLLLCLLGATKVNGQGFARPTFERRFWLGVRSGVNMSRFVFVPRVSQGWHQGPMAGAVMRFNVERGASLQVEANWQRTGWTEKYDDPEVRYMRSLMSIEVPVLTHLYLGQRAVRLFVNAGPTLGYYLSEASMAQGQERFTTRQQLRHSLPMQNRLSWGILGGLGVGVQLWSRHRLELEGRFSYGFGDIWSNKRVDPYVQSSPMTIGASLNYLFKI